MKKFTKEELSKVLELHKKWLNKEEGGVRANLSGANLSGADLFNTSVKTFQLGKHFAYLHEGYLAIGCHGMKIEEWVEKFEEIGKKEGYTKDEITKYGIIIKAFAEIYKI